MLITNDLEKQVAPKTEVNRMIKSDYFNNVLFVGPEHSQRGGIASVLEVYSRSIPQFKFISTYHNKNFLYNQVYFAKAYLKLIGSLITDRQLKIVHLHAASKGSFYRKSIFLLTAKLFGKKTVLHIHSGGFKDFYNSNKLLKAFIGFILNSTDEVVCLSEEWREYFNSITRKQNSIVINNPVILPGKVAVKAVARPYKILFLNHIKTTKGIFDLVQFFNRHKNWMRGYFELAIAGDGDVPELKDYLEANELNDFIDYKGWVSGNDKDELIQQSDVFILPSYFEGLPMSILESMAFGKPIIATNVGGIPSVVKPGENGWLINPKDLDGLEAAFLDIKKTPEILDRFGKGSLRIVQDFSPEKVNDQLCEMYAELLKG